MRFQIFLLAVARSVYKVVCTYAYICSGFAQLGIVLVVIVCVKSLVRVVLLKSVHAKAWSLTLAPFI